MTRFIVFYFTCFVLNFGFSHDTLFVASSTFNKKRLITTTSIIGGTWTASTIGLSQVWYKGVEHTKFHTFNDSKNWLQMDKAGHVYTSYKIGLLTSNAYKWAGMQANKAAVLGTSIGFGFQTTLELFDAYSADWGFSWSDMGANAIGSSLFLGQELAWHEQRFIPKFSYHPTPYAQERPAVLGAIFQERLLKDYNGQTYWLSFNPSLFFESSRIPKWICFSMGYSVDAKIVGDQETYINLSNEIFHSKREFLFSMDIDFSRLPIKKPWLKTLLNQFNYLKIPFPTLLFSNGNAIFKPIYF